MIFLWRILLEKSQVNGTISIKMTRQKEQDDQAENTRNKKGDRKGESNNSPESLCFVKAPLNNFTV